MKKFLLLIISFISLNSLFSQNYKPLLVDGNKWWQSYWDSSGYSFYGMSKYYYFINGNAIINGLTYKKIFGNTYQTCMSFSPSSCVNTNNPDSFAFLMREDVITKKVFASFDNGLTETLVYDFSRNIGETYGDYQTNNYLIQNISFGSVFNQNVRAYQFPKGYYYYAPDFNVYEGIGSSTGLISGPSISFEYGSNLECFENTSGKSCTSQFLGTSENKIQKNLTLYFSKETQDLKIIDTKTQNYSIKFFDASGKILQEIKTKSNENFKLDKNYYNTVLFYIITNNSGSWKGKIIF